MKTVHLLRKPLGSTVAACALKHGTGGVNINRCRVSAVGEVISTHSKSSEAAKGNGIFGAYGSTTTHQSEAQRLGRWPGNLIFQHLEGCRCEGVKKVTTNVQHHSYKRSGEGFIGNIKSQPEKAHWTNKETVANWICEPGCPVARLDEQSGITPGDKRAFTGGKVEKGLEGKREDIYTAGWRARTDIRGVCYAEGGGASRFFHQFSPERVEQPLGRVRMSMLSKPIREYLHTMVSPDHLDDCNTLHIRDPSDFDWSKHGDGTVHAIVAESDSAVEGWVGEALRVLKPGGHLLLASDDTGFKGACAGEDAGFEVRDCILVADSPEDRLHYVAKPSRAEREAGCGSIETAQRDEGRKEGNPGGDSPRNRGVQKRHNSHPTVKPVEVMRRLLETVPKEGVVVDPFLGSGTTMIACTKTGHSGIGIEREEEYIQIADARVRHWNAENQGWNRAKIDSEAPKVEQEEQSLEDFFGWGD